ncbi:MAG: disulfide bond formation protein B [Proteobacteria bacterium]|nr:disulfide bond formation protein B [Pseudomonadota bacterium]
MTLFDKPWLPASALVAVSGAVLLTAFLFEHVGGLAPCELCWYQRYAHMAVLAIASPALYFKRQASISVPLSMAAALAMLVGAAIAGYQVGVEQSWWESSCAAPVKGDTIEELRASLLAAPRVRCDEVAWSLWQISMAGWNALLSLALGAGALYAAFMMERAK